MFTKFMSVKTTFCIVAKISGSNAQTRALQKEGDLQVVFANVCQSESVSTGVWCGLGLGAGFEIALKPSELQNEGENRGKGNFYFCAKPSYAPNPGSKEI